ncbi:GerAB/ArcD/ProY family transporter [Paenibacillus rhizophilus]|uniref:Spore gernimation protein n=1 Tax=Paenibacillus rhizophilus TaxID=1850366 RepID=A0A3N9NY96_9BACL|nr:endospore germination permease [Paenibacillus rhizophilus]RQW08277.1 spore gernimation protein [Paenibacillus rhizophilus]
MQKISNYQLFVLTILFQIGTTIIFGFASAAGRDAWISMLISTLIGIFIISVYLVLMRLHPGLTLVEWYPKQFGKWLGTPIAWLYPLYQIYGGGRMLADLQDLVPTTILPRTPPIFFLTVLMLVIAYGVYLGIETFGRVGEFLLPFFLVLFCTEIILLISSGVVHAENLFPIAGEGLERVLKPIWPVGLTQTFGETVQFAMIWPLVEQQDKIVKTTLFATILTGTVLTLSNIFAISVFGEITFQRSTYPLYSLIREISLADFIENLDAIGVLYFVVTAFFKISLHLFCSIRAIQLLTNSKNSRQFILPVIISSLFMGLTMTDNVASHINGVHMKILAPYFTIPLWFVFPSMLLVVALIRQKLFNQNKG